jgi:amino acid adenylation domain-containing protein
MSTQTTEHQDSTGFRLSPQQELLFAGDAGDPGLRSQCAVRVDGLEPSQLQSGLAAVAQRHEILRTVFLRSAGMRLPSQVILQQLEPDWQVDEAGEGLDAVLEQEAERPFDLTKGPLLRARLLRSSDGGQMLVLTAHAAVADGISLLELARRLRAAHVAEAEEPLQYADYAEWRAEVAAEAAVETEEEQDESSPRLLFGRLPGAGEASSMQALGVPIAPDLAAALEAAAVSSNVQRALFVEACWHACVHRLSGVPSFVLATVTDGRSQSELAGAVGPFAQPLEITSRFETETSLAEIVDQVRRAREAGVGRQDALTAAALGRTVRRGSVSFQSCATSIPAAEIGALRAPAARFSLQLSWLESADGPRAELVFDPSAYDAGDVARIASSFLALLVGASPSAAVDELPIVAAAELEELATLLRGPELDVPGSSYHELFEAQAVRSPERDAVRDGQHSLTYVELNGRANALAMRLAELGVGRNSAVGMCTYRSVESLVAVLGIMKAGGAYVPLNFDHPEARLQHQLAEAGAQVVVAEGDLAERLASFGGTVVTVESTASSETASNPAHVNEPDDLAYVMYTSGSTGLPKGVAVTHANLVNYSLAVADRLGLSEADALEFGVVSAISTDLGNTAIFPALLVGGCVNLVAPDAAMDPEALAAVAGGAGIDVLKVTPSHLGALLGGSDSPSALPRRLLILGGEALPWELVGEISARAPSLKIVNHYGPTETTVGSCTFALGTEVEQWGPATVPIGRPLANTVAYVVDGSGHVAPPGVPGELLLGGAGVARGYVNRPDETAGRFVADRFGDGRVYRTGDRARALPDGSIEFLGRFDDQLKIRGFRVEPGEVEAALTRHPAVKQAAVRALEDASGNARLIAYAVTASDVSGAELHAFVAETLPEYMIPSAFVSLESLPLTASGKIDRLALPDPETLEADREASYVAPRDDVEAEIAGIWGELLGVERVGVFDDFFDLGGQSLLAAQVIMRVRRLYGEVPLQAMFIAPTPAALAEIVRAGQAAAEAAS